MLLPGRNGEETATNYRYSFQGQEHDDEVKGKGNSYDFSARFYDSRVGRWLSMDAIAAIKPSLSPYQSMKNNPMIYIDPDGHDEWYFYENGSWTFKETPGAAKFYTVNGDGVTNDLHSTGNWIMGMLPFIDNPDQDVSDELTSRPQALALFKTLYPKYASQPQTLQHYKNWMIPLDIVSGVASLPALLKMSYKGGKMLVDLIKHGVKLSKGVVTKTGKIKFGKITYNSVKAFEDVTAAELDFLSYADELGESVKVIERGTDVTADFVIKGNKWELKTIENITSKTPVRAVKGRITKALKQSDNVIVDLRNLDDFGAADARAAAKAAFKDNSSATAIRVIGEGYDKTYWRTSFKFLEQTGQ